MNTHETYFQAAAEEAKRATCTRARCGSVIVSRDDEIIGRGYNAPPNNDESQRMCDEQWNLDSKPKSDKTCCVHAEWNAVLEACQTNPQKLGGSTLYFMRIDTEDQFTDAGDPYCTVCSRLVLQAGIAQFALWNREKTVIYPANEYNKLSYMTHAKSEEHIFTGVDE